MMDVSKVVQIVVARADLILCTIGHNLPKLLIAFLVGCIAGRVVIKCLGH